MYISNDHLLEYHCKKCNASGRITKSKLISWGIIDYKLLKMVGNYDINNIKESKYIKKYINNFPPNPNTNVNNKINYINNRLGLNLTIDELVSNKVVLSLGDLLSNNRISNLTVKDYIFNKLNNQYIGFLSYDNSYVNLRNINSDTDFRYYKYNIFNYKDSSGNFYLIPTALNINKYSRIHIAEGPFDILSIKYNVVDYNENYNDVFIAIGGISYSTIVKFVLTELGIINPIFHIYYDDGVKDYMKAHVYQSLSQIQCELYYHNNLYIGEKDYGVSRDKIIDNIVKVI